MKNALGIAFLSMLAAAAGAAAAVYAIKKRDELEQYDYSFDDDDEIFFGDGECSGCGDEEDTAEEDVSRFSESESELAALDGAEEDDFTPPPFTAGEKSGGPDF